MAEITDWKEEGAAPEAPTNESESQRMRHEHNADKIGGTYDRDQAARDRAAPSQKTGGRDTGAGGNGGGGEHNP